MVVWKFFVDADSKDAARIKVRSNATELLDTESVMELKPKKGPSLMGELYDQVTGGK